MRWFFIDLQSDGYRMPEGRVTKCFCSKKYTALIFLNFEGRTGGLTKTRIVNLANCSIPALKNGNYSKLVRLLGRFISRFDKPV